MANSKLEGRYFTPPDEVIEKLTSAISKYDLDSRIKGFSRARGIVDKSRVSYEQMKAIKSYFDNYKGDKTDSEYKLNGGHSMSKWVNDALKTGRDVIDKVKRVRMEAGEENQFKKTHDKDKSKNPSKVGMVKIHKGSKARNIMANDTIYESEIKTIKYLINYLK
jgi:hypothetical protein